MTRPPSIVTFERLYLGSIALYLLNAALFWSTTRELMVQAPQMQAHPEMAALIGGIMLGSLILAVVVSLLFWWLVARARSVVGKWLVVVTEAIGALFGLLALLRLARGTAPHPPSVALGLVATALAVAAAAMLFRPDTHAWFGEDEANELPPQAL